MQSSTQNKQPPPSRGLKQVKVDNWGTFFLQRLQQLYFEEELLDLTIKFPTSDITVQAHRLVITTCTDYFVHLERQQKEKDENFDGVLIMPPDMPYECVKSIISFMYTGQLEYWTSEQNALYRTAQKMNMTVLTKLLDAQFNTSALQSSPVGSTKGNVQPIIVPQKLISPTKKVGGVGQSGALPTQLLPGRKLPIWKRKLDSPPTSQYDGGAKPSETTPGPSRFDLPEVDDFALGVFSSFDDITYNTKPIVKAHDHLGNPSGTNANRSSLDSEERSRKNNDSTEDEDDDAHHRRHNNTRSRALDDKWENSDDDWAAGPKPILRSPDVQATPSKRVRFELEEKENMEKSKNESSSDDAINNHAKIIREVLKKYPHLVKNNKNIRLKIMQKESKSSEPSAPAKTKVSYVVLKSDHLMSNSSTGGDAETTTSTTAATATTTTTTAATTTATTTTTTTTGTKGSVTIDGAETGPWKCNKCDLEEQYTNYYMYRRHMQDVHDEKFDPRVCEHCGYKATKRNILMYHLYTKHNVPPPRSMCFPKCHACSYVALSENLLVRHQINHNHRPSSRTHSSSSADEVQCLTCSQTFKNVNELASHEINTGHGNSVDGKEKSHRCPHCGKVFVRAANLQVHIDCAHKEIREAENRETNLQSTQPIALEPSSEAEALSHVASGIAASLGVGCDAITTDQHEMVADENSFPVCNTGIHLNNIVQEGTYNGHELVEGQQMIMLIDGEAYQTEHIEQRVDHEQEQPEQEQQPEHHHHHPAQAHQLEITGDEQIVMQGTEEGMIVYIHGTEGGTNDHRQNYETYQTVEIGGQEESSEEIVEEVEEVVEEVEEEVVEEEHVDENESVIVTEQEIIEAGTNGEQQIEEVIQYVEEETEIVEYDDSNSHHSNGDGRQQQDSMMIIEEERVDDDGATEHRPQPNIVQHTDGSHLADEWDDDSADMAES